MRGNYGGQSQARALIQHEPPSRPIVFPNQVRTLFSPHSEQCPYYRLFHSHRFCQIAWLVHIGAFENGDMIRQQLQGDGKHNRCDTVTGRCNG